MKYNVLPGKYTNPNYNDPSINKVANVMKYNYYPNKATQLIQPNPNNPVAYTSPYDKYLAVDSN